MFALNHVHSGMYTCAAYNYQLEEGSNQIDVAYYNITVGTSKCLFVCMFVCMCACLFVCLSVCLYVSMFDCLSVSVCFSICLFFLV